MSTEKCITEIRMREKFMHCHYLPPLTTLGEYMKEKLRKKRKRISGRRG